MMLEYLSQIWAAVAPGLGNHLWQSTLCLASAGLLAWVLRKNRAQTRYGLWLAASVKFLIPFSLLVAVGIHLARPSPVLRSVAAGGLYNVMSEVSQPFTKTAVRPQAAGKSRRPAQSAGLRYQALRALPALAVGLWLCGFLAVLAVWWRRWRGISAVLRGATPLREGREAEALRRVEQLGGVHGPLELLLSPASLEPGIFGIFKPVLVWPQGISGRLDDGQLEAILAHEVWHVRHRDNLGAALHMLVEAVFWFHPLVWWLGARLVEERERACDEKVVEWGSERQVYAESILKTCEFCLETPLACVSGITGADLKERIVRIMAHRRAKQLSFARKLLLAVIGSAAVAGPVAFGLFTAPQTRAQAPQTTGASSPSFEVASIRPNHSGDNHFWIQFDPGRFRVTGAKIKLLIQQAYEVRSYQIEGGPSWIESARYDIEAKEEDSQVDEESKLPREQSWGQDKLRLQRLLADRFKLRLSHTTKELPLYALVVAKNGPKLQKAKPGDTYPNGMKGFDGIAHPDVLYIGPGELRGQATTIARLINMLSELVGRNVVDRTGLTGAYDFSAKWTLDQSPTAMGMRPEDGNPEAKLSSPPEIVGSSFFTAIQEQLGLKLLSGKGPVEVLVIDHVERPSEN
jgi:uncharacterized protein (TIGR03435 family)